MLDLDVNSLQLLAGEEAGGLNNCWLTCGWSHGSNCYVTSPCWVTSPCLLTTVKP